MAALTSLLIVLIALFHVCVFFLESVFWERPNVMRAFRITPKNAGTTWALALNQGVYNLFLAAGLAWSLLAPSPEDLHIKVFFLSCVIVAGIVGGFSVSRRIFFLQTLPALLALLLIAFSF